MTLADQANATLVREPVHLDRADLKAVLAAGWADFKAMPQYGLFFATFYMLGGFALYFGMIGQGQVVWFIAIAAGFPLFAPFAALGIYEVSRRRESGMSIGWGNVLTALRGHGNGQLSLMAVTVLIIFGFWVILARGIFAIFFSRSGIGEETLGMLLSPTGVGMVIVGTAVGALIALGLFCITVISLPMLLDKDVDFVTAMITSAETVRINPVVMLQWAALIGVALFVSMILVFVPLLIVLPVLGHATWHLYRRALPLEA
jgi:uncharacterized membrane protein